VCPHGALQDLVLLKPVKVPAWLEQALSVLPYIYLGAGVMFAAVVYLSSGFDGYWMEALGGPPPLWGILLCLGTAALVAAAHPSELARLFSAPLAAWAVAYALLSAAWFAFLPLTAPVTQLFVDRLRSMALLLALLLLGRPPLAQRAARVGLALVVVLSAALNVWDLLHPLAFSNVMGRSAGLFINPNGSGLAIALAVPLAVEVVPPRLRVAFLVTAAGGVALTFSRGAALCLVLALACLMWRRRVSALRLVGAGAVLALAASLTVGFDRIGSALERSDVLNSNTLNRLRFGMEDPSASERWAVAANALDLFLDSPILGAGLGATTTWDLGASAHNMHLTLAAEHGLFGLAAMLALLAILAAASWPDPFPAVLFATAGLFSHNLLDARYALVYLALVGVLPAVREDAPPGLQPSGGERE
jgi:O-antigen ligase